MELEPAEREKLQGLISRHGVQPVAQMLNVGRGPLLHALAGVARQGTIALIKQRLAEARDADPRIPSA